MLLSSEQRLQNIFITLASERSFAIREAQRAIENVSYVDYLKAKNDYGFFNRIIKNDLSEEEAETYERIPELFGSNEFPMYSAEQYMRDLNETYAQPVIFSDGSIVAENDVPF